MNLFKFAMAPAVALSLMTGSAQGQLVINMDYTGFETTGPTGDVNTILNGASLSDAIAVMDHAAAIWEAAFAGSDSALPWATGTVLTQNISVNWADLGGSTLANASSGSSNTAPASIRGRWLSGGSLNWDGDASSSFFVDLTPGDDSEWQQYSERDLDLGGGLINVERVSYDAASGTTTRNNTDFLSVALHEIGHAIGFSSGYSLFSDADLNSDGDIDITTGDFSDTEIAYAGGHTNFLIDSPGNDAKGTGRSDYPYDPGTNQWFENATYNPTAMGPSITTGVRKGLTEADIAIVAEYLAFEMDDVNFNPVPEPSAFALMGLGGLLLVRRPRRD